MAKRNLGKLALIGLLATTLAACASNAPAQKASSLVKIKNNVKLDRVWSKSVGKGNARAALALQPVIIDDRIYTASAGGTVTALETSTGKTLWKVNVGENLTAGPGADSQVVAVAAENGRLIALDPDTGASKWQLTLSGEILAPPLADRGLVVFRTLDGRIRAASAIDGEQQWIINRSVPRLTLRGNSPLVLSDERIYVGLDNGKLMAIGQRDGSLQWESIIAIPSGRGDIERMTDIDGAPLSSDSDIYVNSFQGKLAAVAAESGRVLWSRDFSGLQSLAVYQDYLMAVDTDGVVRAVDRYTSNDKWQQDQLKFRGLTGPATLGDLAIIGDSRGYLHLLNANDGSLAGRLKVDGSAIVNTPTVIGDRLYVQTAGGKLAVYTRQALKVEQPKPVRKPNKAKPKKAKPAESDQPTEPPAKLPDGFDSELDDGFGGDGGGFRLGN